MDCKVYGRLNVVERLCCWTVSTGAWKATFVWVMHYRYLGTYCKNYGKLALESRLHGLEIAGIDVRDVGQC